MSVLTNSFKEKSQSEPMNNGVLRTVNIELNFRDALSFFLGLFSTMPIVGIPIAGHDFSFYRLILAFVIVYYGVLAMSVRRVTFGKHVLKLLAWLALTALSCVIGALFLKGSVSEWGAAARSSLPKVLILLVFTLVWGCSSKARETAPSVVKGFLLGCVLNCVWATMDAACYYVLGFSLNNTLFHGYIVRNNIRYGTLSLIIGGMIRAGGFNYDPAQLGFITPIVTAYALQKKKYWLLLAALGGIMGSASTTGLLCSVLVAFLVLKRKKHVSFRRNRSKARMLLIMIGLPLLFAALAAAAVKVMPLLLGVVERFLSRIGSVYVESGGSNIRLDYLRYAFRAMYTVLPFMVFGTGIGTASLGYANTPSIRAALGESVNAAYDMENTYLAYLLDTGVVGFAVFLLTVWTLFSHYRRRSFCLKTDTDRILYAFASGSALTMLLYHYILFAPQMLMFAVGLSWLDEKGG